MTCRSGLNTVRPSKARINYLYHRCGRHSSPRTPETMAHAPSATVAKIGWCLSFCAWQVKWTDASEARLQSCAHDQPVGGRRTSIGIDRHPRRTPPDDRTTRHSGVCLHLPARPAEGSVVRFALASCWDARDEAPHGSRARTTAPRPRRTVCSFAFLSIFASARRR